MLQAVIFDMDGVLIDSHPVALAMMRECAARNRIPLDDDDYRDWLSMSEAMLRKHSLPRAIEFYLEDYNVEEEIRRYATLRPIAGVVPLIERLAVAGLLMAVATSASQRRATAVVGYFGLERSLSTIVGAGDVTRHKPHGDVYLEAARRLGVLPGNCVAIEDTANGVEAARRASMRVVGYCGPGSAGETLNDADLVIDDFEKLSVGMIVHCLQIEG
ncbi:MAG: HAD family phosphatase [Planctomycetes bacterium]|nr:HAD family phosphatase [Planctomycetota bacterium]